MLFWIKQATFIFVHFSNRVVIRFLRVLWFLPFPSHRYDGCQRSIDPRKSLPVLTINVINLDHREDRWARVSDYSQDFEVTCLNRISACCNSIGHLGCTRSHLRVFESGVWSRDLLLVAEDDIDLSAGEDALLRYLAWFEDSDFDVLCLSGNPWAFRGRGEIVQGLGIQTTAFYVVKKHALPRLKFCFKLSEYFARMGVNQRYSACDQVWLLAQIYLLSFCMVRPGVFPQYESYSDIEGRVVDYGS